MGKSHEVVWLVAIFFSELALWQLIHGGLFDHQSDKTWSVLQISNSTSTYLCTYWTTSILPFSNSKNLSEVQWKSVFVIWMHGKWIGNGSDGAPTIRSSKDPTQFRFIPIWSLRRILSLSLQLDAGPVPVLSDSFNRAFHLSTQPFAEKSHSLPSDRPVPVLEWLGSHPRPVTRRPGVD